jgi:ABC-2 type transport system permease protein
MKQILLIASREFRGYFRSWMGPALMSAALLVMGILFYAFGLTPKLLSAEVLFQYFFYSGGVVAIAAFLLGVQSVAGERQRGSMTLLNTAPLREYEIVLGKYLALLGLILLLLVLSAYLPALVLWRGKVSLGHVVVGYLGMLLFAASAGAIATFASTLSRNYLVIAVAGALIWIVLLTTWFVARVTDPPVNKFFSALALHHDNFRPFAVGVLELDKVVFYLAVTNFFLLAAIKMLEARRWR